MLILKNKGTIIFVIFVVVFLIMAVVFVPKIFPKNNNESELVSISSEALPTSSIAEVKYTLTEMISESDNVILGTVIKADVDENGTLYTLTVSWKDVYKGRNYATMGYSYVKGAQTLEMNKTYLFIGDTNEEKYHYKEPFENAPWVFSVNEDKILTHISNGDEQLVTDLSDISLEKIKSICKNLPSSK